jgi:hypothetical protein
VPGGVVPAQLGGCVVSRLTRVIAPMLRARGLDIREVSRVDGEIRELVVTNPRFPMWGRVVVDRDGLMEWDYWGEISQDAGAAHLAAVIIAIMATRPGDDSERYGRQPGLQPAEERGRPHP